MGCCVSSSEDIARRKTVKRTAVNRSAKNDTQVSEHIDVPPAAFRKHRPPQRTAADRDDDELDEMLPTPEKGSPASTYDNGSSGGSKGPRRSLALDSSWHSSDQQPSLTDPFALSSRATSANGENPFNCDRGAEPPAMVDPPFFSSLSIYVPHAANHLIRLKKHYKGGFRDEDLDVYFPTSDERLLNQRAEMSGPELPAGAGLLWCHPGIDSGTPYPLRAFAEFSKVADSMRTIRNQINFCEDALAKMEWFARYPELHGDTGTAKTLSRLAADAHSVDMVRVAVIIVQIEVQLRDQQVLTRLEAAFLEQLAVQDLEGLQEEFDELTKLSHRSQPQDVLRKVRKQQLATFVRSRIQDNIDYSVYVLRRTLANTEERLRTLVSQLEEASSG